MGKDTSQLELPDLTGVRSALLGLSTDEAVCRLDSALASLRDVAASLEQQATFLESGTRFVLLQKLRRFRSDLKNAGMLAEQGQALCRDWADEQNTPSSYDGSGAVRGTPAGPHGISLEA